VVVVNSYTVSAVEPATRSSSTPMRHLDGDSRENPSSQIPTLCLVKPEPAWADFCGSGGIFLLLGPPASTWAVSVSLTGIRLGVRPSNPKVLQSFRAIQAPDLSDSIHGLCQKCARRTSAIVLTGSCRVGSKGDVTGRTSIGAGEGSQEYSLRAGIGG